MLRSFRATRWVFLVLLPGCGEQATESGASSLQGTTPQNPVAAPTTSDGPPSSSAPESTATPPDAMPGNEPVASPEDTPPMSNPTMSSASDPAPSGAGGSPVSVNMPEPLVGGGAGASAAGAASMADPPPAPTGTGGSPELPSAEAPPVISGLTIEPNPNSTISCYVSWTTDVPATSEVQFGEGDLQFRIRSTEAATEHRVLVIGMHEQTDYVVRAVSTNSMGEDAVDDAFETGMLPSGVADVDLTANEPSASLSGWTLTNIMVGGAGGGFGSSSPAVIVMYDEAGLPVWYYINGDSNDSRGDISADLTMDGNILIGPAPGEPPRMIDLGGNILWEGPNQGGGGAQMTHHAGEISNGDIVVLRDTASGGITGTEIEQHEREGGLVWNWSLLDHVTPNAGAEMDWCHGNSVTVDLEQDVAYVNCRYLGIFKIDRATKDVIWTMHGTQTPEFMGDFSYPVAGSQFNDAHDPELHEDGTMLLYDNGGFAGLTGGIGTFHSRVLEYAIDESALTATLTWEFPGDFPVDAWYQNDWYAAYWGDADRLANGNVFIAIGLKGADLQSRILEVTREGEIVWEITFPANQGLYRAERLAPPPLVESL